MTLIRFFAVSGIAVAMLFGASDVARAQGSVAYSYVANTAPPDAFLALKAYPSSNRPTGEEGWAFSGQGNKAWILCCAANDGSQTEAKSVAKEITDFTCDQLWFGRNSIFKEAGYCFKTPRAIAAFGNAGCLYDEIDAVRLSTENQNFAEAIQRAERVKACPR